MGIDGSAEAVPTARETEPEIFRMLGGRLTLVAAVEPPAGDVVLLRGRMEPGSSVPLHRHSDPECFLVLKGGIEAFAEDERGWRTVAEGRSVTMENGIPHALRAGPDGAELLIATNHRLAGFFRAATSSEDDGAADVPRPADIERVRELSKEYGYWMASPEEHAARTGDPAAAA